MRSWPTASNGDSGRKRDFSRLRIEKDENEQHLKNEIPNYKLQITNNK
jgi:hypothetical protein